MDYDIQQRGRASIDFLCDLRTISDRYEKSTDERARNLTRSLYQSKC